MLPANERFRRQIAYREIGAEGQESLAKARVAICGLGALGSTTAERLVRCGVGSLRLIDRDWVELDNLPRQSLYTLHDAEYHLPKAIAAANHLSAIDPRIHLEPHVCDVTHHNAIELFRDCDLVLDGTDNFETRFLLNDVCISLGLPWVHAGIVGASGQAMLIEPGVTACFRCLLPEAPPKESMDTCDSGGIIGPAVGIIASWQSLLALKRIVQPSVIVNELSIFDLWRGSVKNVILNRVADCPACVERRWEFLEGERASDTKVLCGKNAVQIHVPQGGGVDLSVLATRLRRTGEVVESPFMLRFSDDRFRITIFPDGRGIVHGTENPDEARKIYMRWIGG